MSLQLFSKSQAVLQYFSFPPRYFNISDGQILSLRNPDNPKRPIKITHSCVSIDISHCHILLR